MKLSAHLSWAATLSMPAWEQSSSLPGDPDTPTAPTTSSPTLIGRPPDSASTRVYSLEPTEAGSFCIRLTRPGHADAPAHVVAHLNRQTTGYREHAGVFLRAD